MPRSLSARETNHLLKYGIDPFSKEVQDSGDKPVEYISGFAKFRGLEFYVTINTLIPRIETETLIDIAIDHVKNVNQDSYSYIDIGTGSGAIGISFALELQSLGKKYSGLLSDLSERALGVALENIKKHAPLNLSTAQSNLLEKIPAQKFDVIFANLPYIPSDRMDKLQNSVKDFEPHLALDGGDDGLVLIKRLLNSISDFMYHKSMLLLEVDDVHNANITKEVIPDNLTYEVLPDLNGKNRFWIVQLKP